MKIEASEMSAAGIDTEEDLLRLEIRIARRADELSRSGSGVRERDLEHWLQAEREVLRARWQPAAAG